MESTELLKSFDFAQGKLLARNCTVSWAMGEGTR